MRLLIMRFSIVVVVMLSMVACRHLPTQPPPAPETITVPFDQYRLDIPGGGAVANIDRTFVFYAGAHISNFGLMLNIRNLPPDGFVEVRSGDNSTVIQTITSNGMISTANFGGNVGRLRVRVPTIANPAPDVIVETITTTRMNRFVAPSASAAVGNTMSAFPLTVGEPVDFVLNDDRPDSFYFTVKGMAGRAFDIILVGAASVWIGDPQVHGFPMSSGHAIAAFTPTRRAAPALTYPSTVIARFPAVDRDSLFIAVTNQNVTRMDGVRDAFHARLMVVPISDAQQLAFPSSMPAAFFPWPVGMDRDGARTSNTSSSIPAKLACTNYAGVTGISNVVLFPVPGFAAPPGLTLYAPPVCYDGHSGTDFLLAPEAVNLNVPVTAAASGVVIETLTGNVDTCGFDPTNGFAVTCPGTPNQIANFVLVRQDDGRLARYYHLRNQSLPVAAGDRVVCGQLLGRVGSSGISALPHLHFEINNMPNETAVGFVSDIDAKLGLTNAIDPYPNLWRATLPGNVPLPACM